MIKNFEEFKKEYNEIVDKLEKTCTGHTHKTLAPALMLIYSTVMKDEGYPLEKAVECAIISLAEVYGVRTQIVDDLLDAQLGKNDVKH